MPTRKSRTGKQKIQPGFSPKPTSRATALTAGGPYSPSPSPSLIPETLSPNALVRKARQK